jgi:hypothetical protein
MRSAACFSIDADALLSKFKLTQLHIHAPAAKPHSLCFQPQALFYRRIAAQLDLSTRA